MSNGYGNYHQTRPAAMAAYDSLPPRLRWAVAYAVSPFATSEIEQRLRRGDDERDIIADMRAADRAQTVMAYGLSHPQVFA